MRFLAPIPIVLLLTLYLTTTLSIPTFSDNTDLIDLHSLFFNTTSRSSPLTCETSNGSPHHHSIHDAANHLFNYVAGNQYIRCHQSNLHGSKCTEISRHADASITICGKHEGWLECTLISWAAKHIADVCMRGRDRRAGGVYRFEGRRIYVAVH